MKLIVAVMEIRACVLRAVSVAQLGPRLTRTVAECDKALEALVAEEPVKINAVLKGL